MDGEAASAWALAVTFDCEAWPTDRRCLVPSCNDGDANTVNDQWDAELPVRGSAVTFDCEGVASGLVLSRHVLQRRRCEHDQRPVDGELPVRGHGDDLRLRGRGQRTGAARHRLQRWRPEHGQRHVGCELQLRGSADCDCQATPGERSPDAYQAYGDDDMTATTCGTDRAMTSLGRRNSQLRRPADRLPRHSWRHVAALAPPATMAIRTPSTINGTMTATASDSSDLRLRKGLPAVMPCQEPCDDGNANTGNDAWDSNCNCSGQVVDCAGVAGGSAFIDQCGVCAGGSTGNVPNADSDGDGLLRLRGTTARNPGTPIRSDFDEDGVGDDCDNCVWTYRPDQSDADGDGIGMCDVVSRVSKSRPRSGHGDIPESGPRDGAHIDRGSRVKRLSPHRSQWSDTVLDVQRTNTLQLDGIAAGIYTVSALDAEGRPLAQGRLIVQ